MASGSYLRNPMIHRDRRLANADSDWVKSFGCEDMTVLIVCRGPIRQEALDVFGEMGMSQVGILLSEKDSIVYPRALAPELRRLDPSRVHNVQDYTGASGEERTERIAEIIAIAKDNGYDYIFAGYGFMAEDEEFVYRAGLGLEYRLGETTALRGELEYDSSGSAGNSGEQVVFASILLRAFF